MSISTRAMFFILLMFSSLCSNAETWSKAHTWGGPATDQGVAVTIDSSGAIYAVGSTSSFGGGGQDVLIVKYSSAGTVDFAKTWGGGGNEYATAIAVGPDGNIFVSGATNGFGSGWYDAFLLKLNKNGALIWGTTWGGGSYETGEGIAFDSGGNIYLVGQTYSFGPCCSSSVLIKFNSNGAVLQTVSYKGPATYDTGLSIAVDSNQNVIVAGISWDYSVYPLHNSILILKYDALGKLLWSKNWSSTFPAQDESWGFNAVTTDNAGNIYIGGRHSDQCNTFDFSQCDFRSSALKLNPDGDFLWARTWGMAGAYSAAGSVALDSQGRLLVPVVKNVFGTGGAPSMIGVLSYDSVGGLLSQSLWSQESANHGSVQIGLALDSKDQAFVVGLAQNNSGVWVGTSALEGTLGDALVSNSHSVDAPVGTSTSLAIPTVTQTGTDDAGGGGDDLFIAQYLVPARDLGVRAAALAKTLIGAPYGYGGKGYNFDFGPYAGASQIVDGYNYYTSACGTKVRHLGVDSGIDCSGLVMWAYNTAYGATDEYTNHNPVVQESADGQFLNNFKIDLKEADIQPGDLLFFHVDGFDKGRPKADHVAMYLGNEEVVEAPDCGKSVKTSSLRTRIPRDPNGEPVLCPPNPQQSCFLGFRRLSTPDVKVAVRTHSPVTLAVSDPDGYTIDATAFEYTEREALREIPGVMYYFEDTNGDDTVISPILKTGDYLVKVFPKPGTQPTDTYSLSFETAAAKVPLATNVPLSEIPVEGYGIESQGGDVVKYTPVAINIKPRDPNNKINLKIPGLVAVALLSNSAFSAGSIDTTSLRFGRTGDEPSLASCNRKLSDVNVDGFPDLLCRFYVQMTGFQAGDTVGVLQGVTKQGATIRGKDSVLIKAPR